MRDFLKGAVTGLAGLLAFVCSASAQASYDPSKPGWTEVINCSLFRNQWGNGRWSSNWGTQGLSEWNITPQNSWWNYAHLGNQDMDCDAWVDGELVGAATYVAGYRSVPQGVDVNIYTYFSDNNVVFNQDGCGHQHAVSYVWGWRYFGSSWGFEFVNAHMLSTYWDSSTQACEFKGDGNPLYADLPALAFGANPIAIHNSPYAVLYTKSQAITHYNAGCGQFECFHPVQTVVQYCPNGVCGNPY
jgi:hypothetical protein